MTSTPAQADSSRPGDPPARDTIIQVDEDRRLAAVERLVSAGRADPDHARRFLRFAEENEIDLTAMWARLDDRGRVQATVLVVPNPGRTAMVFATPARRDRDVAPVAEVVDHACSTLLTLPGRGEVQIAQSLLDPGDRLDRRTFGAAGFDELAGLSYLERHLPGSPIAPPDDWPPGTRLTAYDESLRPALVETLAASYEDTRDCPGLVGLRRTEDILAGHEATGQIDPDLWTLLLLDERPSGVLLLNPSSQGACIELVYLGLTVAARGRGLGRQLLRHGLAGLRHRPEKRVTLAVDDDNTPALRLYRSEGFKRTLRRVAMIRKLQTRGVSSIAAT